MGLKASGGPSGKGWKRRGLRSQAGPHRHKGDKVEWAEASGAPPEAAENCGAAREADKANGARLGAAEDCGGMNKPA